MACRPFAAWTQAGRPARLWTCERPWDWAALLAKLATDDEQELSVRMLADAFRELPRQEQPAAVQAWTQSHVEYVNDRPPAELAGVLEKMAVAWPGEPFERFQAPAATIARGKGDCDDSSRVVRATLRALGWPARLVFMGDREGPSHVCAAIPTRAGWFWLDASLPALPGEHPATARKRTLWTAP